MGKVLPAVLFAVITFNGELLSQSGGTVTGTVTAANKMPLQQARVRVTGTELATVTRVNGAFEVTQVPAGRQKLEVVMIGYTPTAMAVEISEGATLRVTVALEPLPLQPVTVTADANFFVGLRGFEERKARGTGRYFTRKDIDMMQARQVTDVLRRVPGMQVETGPGAFSGGSTTARSGRNGGGSGAHTCGMTYYMNGSPFPLAKDVPINTFVAPDDIAAIEVYTGSSQIPPEFNSSIHNSSCGVVAIWTRSTLDARVSH
jgi:outer membrane receptor for Fe3+-dicitrate